MEIHPQLPRHREASRREYLGERIDVPTSTGHSRTVA